MTLTALGASIFLGMVVLSPPLVVDPAEGKWTKGIGREGVGGGVTPKIAASLIGNKPEPTRTNPNQSERKRVIVIDPGHPSEVGRGTKGKFITEIEAAWQVGQRLSKLLKGKGYRVVFTKKTAQTYVANKNRAAVANKENADLMIRLHCDHAIGHTGFGAYYADRQGTHSGFTGPPKETLALVKKMAGPFHRAAMSVLKGKLNDRGLRPDRQTNVGSKYGALVGSIYSKQPSILVEMCVLSTAKDETFIRSKIGQEAMAKAIAAGIEAALAVAEG